MKIKQIAILGSTGSIGKNALRVVEALGESFEIFALSAHNNIDILAAQVKHFKPKVVCISNESKLKSLKQAIGGIDVEILSGPSGLVEISKINEIDIVLMSVVGAAGLQAILAAAQKGKRLAIANKEPLVIAGKLLIEAAKKSGSEILPIDSEHSAIFQSMQAGNADEVNKIILTASGGPFRDASKKQMDEATIEQALAHPTWQMGPKITVDSATM
ncbi:MAG: 1-deoxy-D-xylulose-5-phosphate reductoisomerase, partial [Phycisphaerae bacterium]